MKRFKFLIVCLLASLLLTACIQGGNTDLPDPPVTDDQQTVQPNTDQSDNGNTDSEPVRYPADLTVELVIDWAMADIMLSHLDDFSDLLRLALQEVGCEPDSVTLTISTAGGFTAQALVEGGIDIAILPAVDIIPYEKSVNIIALSSEEIPETAFAVSSEKEDLSDAFRQLLFRALTETQHGTEFLAACCGEATLVTPDEELLQIVRDYREELEKAEGGHLA